jgi:hypothetical protein
LSWFTTGTWSEGIYYEGDAAPSWGYGVLTFKTGPDRVALEVKDDEGTTVITHTVGLE